MAERLAQKLLLIGWDGADWQIIKPLLERGEMPALQSLIEQGVMGNFASMRPMISPMLWTSMATGKVPYLHGICGFTEPDPNSEKGARPVTSTSRKCKAFWNILTQSNIKNHVVGWFAGHPAEPINGVCVSELFAKPIHPVDQAWPIVAGSVHPRELSETLAELRIHPQDLSLDELEHFIPQVRSIDQTNDKNVRMLALQLAECATNQAATTWIMETQPWEMIAVYFNTIDHLCHGFMYFHPPRMEHIPEQAFALYKDVVNTTYKFHDMMLGRLLKLAGEETTVMIVSDHGYQTGHRRPILTPQEPSGPVAWHRPYGICVLKGPHIRRDELLFGGRILDVAPTVLTLFGLPIGEDMAGVPLVQAFDRDIVPEKIPSWEDVPGECGMHSGEIQSDPFAEMAAMNQLAELGYIDSLADDKQTTMRRAADEAQYNLGCSLMWTGRYSEAVELLEAVHRNQPTRLAVAYNLADCYQRLERIEDCRNLIDHIAAGNCSDPGMEDKNIRVVPQVDLLRGLLELNSGNPDEAIKYLLAAEKAVGKFAGLHRNIGNTYLRMNRWDDAARAFEKALDVDPDDPEAYHGMTVVCLSKNQDQLAVDNALRSIEILYHQPHAHFHLGLALSRLGKLHRAKQALQVSITMNPNNPDAQKLFSQLGRT